MAQRLHCEIRSSAWGRSGDLSALTGAEPTGTPEAELWMGAHPTAPSRLDDGRSLLDVIADSPVATLGERVVAEFGELPFLFKVLAAALPLSIQAHPSQAQARAGFAREEAAGIPLGARERTYPDPNHKPELICALTPFEAKCGFRSLEATHRLFVALLGAAAPGPGRPDLESVVDRLAEGGSSLVHPLLEFLFGLDPRRAADLADGTAAAAETLLALGSPEAAEFRPELEATGRIATAFPGDVGGVVALLLNHVVLAPGEALFLGAGNLHAYLSGVGVELMANSDNVLRGGLTPKHIDTTELLAALEVSPGPVVVQRPHGPVHRYRSPVPEFTLTRVELSTEPTEVVGPAIVLVTDGAAHLGETPVDRGTAWFVAAADGPIGLSGSGLAWVAGVGASLTEL